MNDLTKIEEMLLIGIWRLKDEAYGYKIRQYISEIIQKDFTYGNLYSALNQLVKKEYVTKRSDPNDKQTKGKQKVYYSVTPSGIQALKSSRIVNNILWDGLSDSVLDITETG